MEPFTIDVPDDDIADLKERLARTRWPDQIPGSGWDYGTDLSYLRELCDYWQRGFDWRKQEAEINQYDQFVTEIDGQRLHFLHVRSQNDDAFPLVISHGWPGSIVEFLDIIGPLTDQFHVVAPSLPGYGWSGPTTEPGWDVRRIATAFAELMARLGYERYGAQGGDWGAMVSTQLGLVDPEHVAGIHLNMVVAGPPEGTDFSGLSEQELAGLTDMGRYQDDMSGYAKIQSTRPQTIGYPLNDSPAGLAAWIVEKFREWSDCDGDVERRFTKDRLLTNISTYWFTGTAGSSARLYCESTRAGRFGLAGERVEVPTGCAVFPREIIRPPRSWAETAFNVTHWTEMPAGGHFAAMEEPGLLVDDIRAFFGGLQSS